MKLRILAQAKRELFRTSFYYDRKSQGLADRFLEDVEKNLELIRIFPRSWKPMGGDLHRCRLDTFRYGILYRLATDEIIVLAIGHLSRGPAFWRKASKRRT